MKKFICLFMAFFASLCCCFASSSSDYMNGREAFYKKEYQSALNYYNNAIAKDENYGDAYCGKGEVEIELKKFDKAIESYTKAIELNENDINAYIGRAAAYGLKSKPNLKLAKDDLNKAIEIDSKNTNAYKARAVVNYGLKDKKSAYKDINYVLEAEPNDPHAYGIKAMFEFSDFKFADSMKSFEKFHEYNKAQNMEPKKSVEPKFEQGFEGDL